MSYGLGPFAVELASVERVFGCRDVALADAILREEAVDDDVDEAVRDIIEGREFRDGPEDGPLYGRALRELCRHFGRELPTEYFLYDDLVGAVEVGPVEVGPGEDGPAEMGPGEVGPGEMGPDEVREGLACILAPVPFLDPCLPLPEQPQRLVAVHGSSSPRKAPP